MSHARPTSPPSSDLLTPLEVAQLLRASRSFVHNETHAGRLPAVRLGRYLRYRRRDVQHYITEATENGTLLTATDVAQLLRASRSFVHTATRAGDLPAVRLGRYLRYRRRDVDRYITEATDPSTRR